MGYVMLYGVGWTQRWRVAEASVALLRAEIDRVGRDETGHLPVLDPGTGEPTTLIVAWQHVAAAIILDSDNLEDAENESASGQYR